MAIVVADAEQRRGIGTALAQRLLRDARSAGIRLLRAEILASNRGMLALLKTLDVPLTRRAFSRGELTVEIDLSSLSGDRAGSVHGGRMRPPQAG